MDFRFVVSDSTLTVEHVKSGGGFRHEHPDSYSSLADDSAATGSSLQQDILSAIEADMLMMQARSGGSWRSHVGPSTAPAQSDLSHDVAPRDASLSSLLSDMLGCFVLRRTKDNVDLKLPPKTRVENWVDASPFQARVLETLKQATLLLLGPHSVLGQSVLSVTAESECDAVTDTVHASTLPAPLSELSRSPAFVGDLGGVIPQSCGTEQCLADIAAGHVGNASGKLLMLLRKAALHPLLLRSRYCDERVLSIATLVFEASQPLLGPMHCGTFVPLTEDVVLDKRLIPAAHQSAPEGAHGSLDVELSAEPDCGGLAALNATLVEQHKRLPRGALLQWANAQLISSMVPATNQKPPAKFVKALADLADSFLRASVRASVSVKREDLGPLYTLL